jgi:hypothetical protein
MRLRLFVAAVGALGCAHAAANRASFPAVRLPGRPPAYELRHGLWFDGHAFAERTRWSVYGALTDRRPEPVDSVIDLEGGYVVPAFGEAHNHNAVPSDTGIAHRYLRDGIFYVKNPSNFVRERDAAAGLFNTPTSIDVVFSNAGLTGPGGHPLGLARRNIARGVWKPEDGEGSFYFTFASRADVNAKLPTILATRPDFIKTFLLYSESYRQRLTDSTTLGWRGLDPALLPYIVEKVHAARLRVTTHVETAADFRNAVAAGVDEINHLPGFRPEGDAVANYSNLDPFRLTTDDARAAARRSVVVVTTVGATLDAIDASLQRGGAEADLAKRVREMLIANLRVLRDAGVTIAIGSDSYRQTSAPEVFALRRTGVFSDTALLRMWSTTTSQAIFPGRRIGKLDAGWEASFIVLDENPLENLENARKISLRMKQGVLLP